MKGFIVPALDPRIVPPPPRVSPRGGRTWHSKGTLQTPIGREGAQRHYIPRNGNTIDDTAPLHRMWDTLSASQFLNDKAKTQRMVPDEAASLSRPDKFQYESETYNALERDCRRGRKQLQKIPASILLWLHKFAINEPRNTYYLIVSLKDSEHVVNLPC